MFRCHPQTPTYDFWQSDHPVINSRYLLFEAQQAHYYGLPENLALGSVTTQPAQVIGLDHRIGYIKEGRGFELVRCLLSQ
jgi:imidazolonepropionase-like amidohydrolase